MSVSYCLVTLDQGSGYYLPAAEFSKLHRAMAAYLKTGVDSIYLCSRLEGGHCAFFMSKIQDIMISTPETRAEWRKIKDMLDEEDPPEWMQQLTS